MVHVQEYTVTRACRHLDALYTVSKKKQLTRDPINTFNSIKSMLRETIWKSYGIKVLMIIV